MYLTVLIVSFLAIPIHVQLPLTDEFVSTLKGIRTYVQSLFSLIYHLLDIFLSCMNIYGYFVLQLLCPVVLTLGHLITLLHIVVLVSGIKRDASG